MFSLTTLLSATMIYVGLLFLIAKTADRSNKVSLLNGPFAYTLSLGVYATSWSFYGSVGFAASDGLSFLTIYFGLTIAFAMAPFLLSPILRLTNTYNLSSIADLFAFRYGGQLAGGTVTLLMMIGILPYLSLQIRAITESMSVIAQQPPPDIFSFFIALMLLCFSLLFAKNLRKKNENNHGLVSAIAVESMVKLIALLLAGGIAVWGVFDGPIAMQQWLDNNPETLDRLYTPVQSSSWVSMVLLSFCAAFLLPRQFHMIFHENRSDHNLNVASWAFPVYLLLLNLPIIPIYLAGQASLHGAISADYTVLGITQHNSPAWVTMLVFLGGVSSASAMVIVTTLALASMFQNYFIMPGRLHFFSARSDLYRILIIGRRLVITAIMLAAYVFTMLLKDSSALAQLGLISFVAVAQLLPGIIGLLFWPRATGSGFVAGLVAGTLVWFLLTVLPIIRPSYDFFQAAHPDHDLWGIATFWTLFVNSSFFLLVSLLSLPKLDESEAAEICADQSNYERSEQLVTATGPAQFKTLLSSFIGETSAYIEVNRALEELQLENDERRPAKLRLLRDQIQRNLSTLVGPVLAKLIVDDRIEVEKTAKTALSDSVLFFENRIAQSQTELKGLAADLDRLRRYQKTLLEVMPIGVCAFDAQSRISLWNQALTEITGLSHEQSRGSTIASLPAPWGQLILEATAHEEPYRQLVQAGDDAGTIFNISRAVVVEDINHSGNVVLIEDRSEWVKLESELAHKERLASIGRFAAGVAHEIGNPLTGVASLTQLLKADSQDKEDIETYNEILKQTARIDNIVKSLLSMSHAQLQPGLNTVELKVADIIQQAVSLTRLGLEAGRSLLEVGVVEDLNICGDEARLVQALVNLLQNSVAATSTGLAINVSATRIGQRARIEVRDQGSGINDEIRAHIFDPFFTTKPAGQGTGLGLALVLRSVQMHGGLLKYRPNKPKGAIFTIWLNLSDAN